MYRLSKTGRLIIIFVVFLVIYGCLIVDVTSRCDEKAQEVEQLLAENRRLTDDNDAYERELRYVQSNEGIRLYAHMYGFQFRDETRYSAVYSGNK